MHAVPHPMQSAECYVSRHLATTWALLYKMHISRIPVVEHPWALHTRAFLTAGPAFLLEKAATAVAPRRVAPQHK